MDLAPLIADQYVVKLIIAALDTPFIYVVTRLMDKIPVRVDAIVQGSNKTGSGDVPNRMGDR